MKRSFNKRDLILGVVLLLLFSALYIVQSSLGKNSENDLKLIVVRDGKDLATMSVSDDGDYIVTQEGVFKNSEMDIEDGEGYNRFKIEDGIVDVTSASCPDGLCTKMKKISRQGEMIVCLPHKLYFKIIGKMPEEGDGDSIDAITD